MSFRKDDFVYFHDPRYEGRVSREIYYFETLRFERHKKKEEVISSNEHALVILDSFGLLSYSEHSGERLK